jgi:hypothetical protein
LCTLHLKRCKKKKKKNLLAYVDRKVQYNRRGKKISKIVFEEKKLLNFAFALKKEKTKKIPDPSRLESNQYFCGHLMK